MTSWWSSSSDSQGTAPTTEREGNTADTPRLDPKTLAMLVDRGASGNYVDDELHWKLEGKAREGRLCGHSMNSKAYRVYSKKKGRAIESCDIIFIKIPASTLVKGNTTGDAGSTHADSSQAETRTTLVSPTAKR